MEAKVFELVNEASGNDTVLLPETRLDALALDSLEFMELILELQNQFHISISDEELGSLNTIQDLLKCIASHSAQA